LYAGIDLGLSFLPGWLIPDKSPFTSTIKTEMPIRLSPSAIICKLTVFLFQLHRQPIHDGLSFAVKERDQFPLLQSKLGRTWCLLLNEYSGISLKSVLIKNYEITE
jgi:hypothetical protein